MIHDSHCLVSASSRAGSNTRRPKPLLPLWPALILIAAIALPAAGAAYAAPCGSAAHTILLHELAMGKSFEVLDIETGKTFQMTKLPSAKTQPVVEAKKEVRTPVKVMTFARDP
jgi:hypothetical protein